MTTVLIDNENESEDSYYKRVFQNSSSRGPGNMGMEILAQNILISSSPETASEKWSTQYPQIG